jgi:hypothetical protein
VEDSGSRYSMPVRYTFAALSRMTFGL